MLYDFRLNVGIYVKKVGEDEYGCDVFEELIFDGNDKSYCYIGIK